MRVMLLTVILVWFALVNVNPARATIMSVRPPSPTANQSFTISGTSSGTPLVVFSGSGCYGSPVFSLLSVTNGKVVWRIVMCPFRERLARVA